MAEVAKLHCSGEMYPENLLPQLPRVVKWSCKEYAGFKDLSQIPVVTEQKKKEGGDGSIFQYTCDAIKKDVEATPSCSYQLQTLKSILNIPV